MTRKEAYDQIKNWIGLQDISAYDEGGLIDDLLYAGAIDLLARTKCVARCIDLHVSAGVDTYKLDHAVLALVDIEDGSRPRARRDQSTLPSGFTLIRSDILRVQPAPSADGTVQTWAVMRPAQMTDDTNDLGDDAYGGFPDEFQDAIITYALWKASDYADDASGVMGERYRVLYEGQDGRGGRLAQIRAQINRRGTAKGPAPSGAATRRSTRVRSGLARWGTPPLCSGMPVRSPATSRATGCRRAISGTLSTTCRPSSTPRSRVVVAGSGARRPQCRATPSPVTTRRS